MKQSEYDILFFEVKKKPKLRRHAPYPERTLGQRAGKVISAEAGDYGYTTFLKREFATQPKGS